LRQAKAYKKKEEETAIHQVDAAKILGQDIVVMTVGKQKSGIGQRRRERS
jgi:hypothetical protein